MLELVFVFIVSVFFSSSHLPGIKEIFPNTSLEFLHAGHLVHVEQPHAFIQTVTKFINR